MWSKIFENFGKGPRHPAPATTAATAATQIYTYTHAQGYATRCSILTLIEVNPVETFERNFGSWVEV